MLRRSLVTFFSLYTQKGQIELLFTKEHMKDGVSLGLDHALEHGFF